MITLAHRSIINALLAMTGRWCDNCNMFKVINCKVELSHLPFENLRYRDRTVLILPKDKDDKFLLGAKKDIYPDGIVRMLGGGIDKNEEMLEAAIRETAEETGLELEPDRFIPLIQVNVEGKFDGETFTHTAYIYFLQLEKEKPVSGDDVSEIIKMNEEDYRQLVANYFALANDHYFEYPGGKFSWGDYGKVYGFIHESALDEVLARDL